MREEEKSNQAMWDDWAAAHAGSKFYDVAGFKAGKNSLSKIELEELGDVNGKTLLHLQCHFGMDTLSWARLGAQVTGVDFSPKAIELAQALSQEIGASANFVCASIYDLPQALEGQFDIVFTSYGVLCWLSDLPRWGQVIAHFLKPGGVFYIADGHPFAMVFNNEPDAASLQVAYPYFHQDTPVSYQTEGSYAVGDVGQRHTGFEWVHSLGDIINALLGAGLRLEYLHEFPFGFYQHFPFMRQGEDGSWRLPELSDSVPLVFSIRATKPAAG